MGKDPSMPLYVNDWLSSSTVTCMTPEQQCGYMRLLCHCWASQKAALPDNEAKLSFLSGLSDRWSEDISIVLRACFRPHPDIAGMLTNERLYTLWTERQEFRELKRQSGIAGNKKRWGTKKAPKTTKKQASVAQRSVCDTECDSRTFRSSSSTSVEEGDSASEEIPFDVDVSRRNAKTKTL